MTLCEKNTQNPKLNLNQQVPSTLVRTVHLYIFMKYTIVLNKYSTE